jgi:hypothetical protein
VVDKATFFVTSGPALTVSLSLGLKPELCKIKNAGPREFNAFGLLHK